MRNLAPTLVLSLALAAGCAAPAYAQDGGSGAPAPPPTTPEQPPTTTPEPPAPPLEVDVPVERTLIHEGQDDRYLMAGRWYFRQDDSFLGEAQRWFAGGPLDGWTAISVPHSWNANDTTLNKPTVGWYRKEFRVPKLPRDEAKAAAWKIRFEGSNFRTNAWLNGRYLGRYEGYFPFELDLPGIRKGRNTLVLKVSTLRAKTDLTHWRPAAYNGFGTGGWWNSGGLLREVYLRKVDTVDLEDVRVIPRLRCLRCEARVEVSVTMRNLTKRKQMVGLAFEGAGQRIELFPREVDGGARRELVTRLTIPKPELWDPRDPHLYDLRVTASVGDEDHSSYRLRFGVRKIQTLRGGGVELNGRPLHLRGASIHEDDLREGAALSPRTRALLISRLRNLGANATRSHYPLHPAFLEAFDRLGILYWVQAPVYQLPNALFDLPGVRAAALTAVRRTVVNNVNHPSVLTWSVANEPAGGRSELGVMGPGLASYISQAAREVRSLDDTRLVAYDRQSRFGEPPTYPVYRELDALGVNEYFGWYDSYKADLVRPPTTSDELGPYLDELHAANPNLPLFITEFGAEAVRGGPATQPGSYEFQDDFVVAHLRIHASKPFVNGSILWALRDFRVEPNWQGGAPGDWSTPPWHNKSAIDESNMRKPLYFELRKRWRRAGARR